MLHRSLNSIKTTVRLQIWDDVRKESFEAGQELFRAVVRSFYKSISAVFLLYSIDNSKEVKNWMREVQQHAHEEVVVILIGSRSDLQDKREVSK
jgi:GTPase SAR1 family protein